MPNVGGGQQPGHVRHGWGFKASNLGFRGSPAPGFGFRACSELRLNPKMMQSLLWGAPETGIPNFWKHACRQDDSLQ